MEQLTNLLPVLLGSDANVYGMARSFYMEYGVTSLAIGKGALAATANSKLVKIAVVEPRLEEDEVFVAVMKQFAADHPNTTRVLVSCGDNYTGRFRSAEVLLREDCSTQLIRRAETPDDYFSTMYFFL